MRVIGYAYEADLHCVACTEDRFPVVDGATDREGNEVHPMFDTDEHDELLPPHCCDCGELIE